jgi:hypothetical protein
MYLYISFFYLFHLIFIIIQAIYNQFHLYISPLLLLIYSTFINSFHSTSQSLAIYLNEQSIIMLNFFNHLHIFISIKTIKSVYLNSSIQVQLVNVVFVTINLEHARYVSSFFFPYQFNNLYKIFNIITLFLILFIYSIKEYLTILTSLSL